MERFVNADAFIKRQKDICKNVCKETENYCEHCCIKNEVLDDLDDFADDHSSNMALIGLKNVREVIDRYCTKYCSFAKYYFGRFKDVDEAMEHLERKCENCPLKEI